MPIAVQGHRVARHDDLARERRVAAHLLADQEEGRPRPGALERRQHRRGAGRGRPVAEGHRHAGQPVDPPRDAQRRGERRGVSGRGRGRPRRRGRADREDGGTHERMVAAMSASTGAGLVVAALAAACYETGYAFQALEARGVGARHALRASLIGQLVRNGRWLAATALSLLGWPLQVLALSLAPLALVQPTLALGLLLLLVLGTRVLGERVGRRELAAVALVVVGIAGLAAAAPDRSTVTGGTGMTIAVAVLAALAVAPYALRRRRAGLLAVMATGAADSVAALAAQARGRPPRRRALGRGDRGRRAGRRGRRAGHGERDVGPAAPAG